MPPSVKDDAWKAARASSLRTPPSLPPSRDGRRYDQGSERDHPLPVLVLWPEKKALLLVPKPLVLG